jgi:hypothetical protein
VALRQFVAEQRAHGITGRMAPAQELVGKQKRRRDTLAARKPRPDPPGPKPVFGYVPRKDGVLEIR